MLKHIICRKCYIKKYKLGRRISEAKIELVGNETTVLLKKNIFGKFKNVLANLV